MGGSAGGLEAYNRLLRNLPADMSAAIVIVNHEGTPPQPSGRCRTWLGRFRRSDLNAMRIGFHDGAVAAADCGGLDTAGTVRLHQGEAAADVRRATISPAL